MSRVFVLHGAQFRRGLLMHLTLNVCVFAFVVVAGPAMAWSMNQSFASLIVALTGLVIRSWVAAVHSRAIWRAEASPKLVLSTSVSSGMAGYLLVFAPLILLGSFGGSHLLGAVANFLVDAVLVAGALAAGSMIAAGKRRRRRFGPQIEMSKLPIAKEVAAAFEENRHRQRLNM